MIREHDVGQAQERGIELGRPIADIHDVLLDDEPEPRRKRESELLDDRSRVVELLGKGQRRQLRLDLQEKEHKGLGHDLLWIALHQAIERAECLKQPEPITQDR